MDWILDDTKEFLLNLLSVILTHLCEKEVRTFGETY